VGQTFIDTYSRVAHAHVKLYTQRNSLVAADALNDRVLPFFEEHGVELQRILTDRGSEYCGSLQTHSFELYLAVEDMASRTATFEHTKARAYRPQTNGICERFHKTLKEEFYDVAFRRKLYHTLDELQTDVDAWMVYYNTQRPHSGRYCFGKTPMQTFLDAKHIALDKQALSPSLGMFLPTRSGEVESAHGLAGQGQGSNATNHDPRQPPLTGQAADYTRPEHAAAIAIIGQPQPIGQS
jgi:hypothetical protein